MALTKNKPETEITKVEVLKELPLEKIIDQTLIKNNVTKKVITALKDKYGKGDLVLKSLDDKEQYLIIKESRRDVRRIGILVENLCKKGREDAVKTQRAWLSKEKELLSEIAEVQDPLDAEIKKFEDEEKRIEAEEQTRKDNQFNTRQAELIKMGAMPANGCMNLNDLSIEFSNIRESDDEDYNETILPLFQRLYEKNEQEKVALQKKKDEEAALLKQQQEELAAQQAELQKQRDEFAKQQQEAARLENEKRQKAEAEEKQKQIDLQQQRVALLFPVNPTGADVDMATLWTLEEDKFQEILTAKKAEFKEKQAAETLRLQEEAATKERLRIEQEQKDAEIKRQQEEQRQLEEAAKASDKDKWIGFVNSLKAVAVPEFKSSIYKSKLAIAKEKIEEITSL